jgi:hypothetical protein
MLCWQIICWSYSRPKYSDFRNSVATLNLDIYQLGWIIQRICIALCLNDECKQTVSISNKLSQTVLAADSGLPFVPWLLSLYCLLLCATLTWSKFSQLRTDIGDINTVRAVLRVIGCGTTVMVNYEYTCYDFDTFVLKERVFLKEVKSDIYINHSKHSSRKQTSVLINFLTYLHLLIHLVSTQGQTDQYIVI